MIQRENDGEDAHTTRFPITLLLLSFCAKHVPLHCTLSGERWLNNFEVIAPSEAEIAATFFTVDSFSSVILNREKYGRIFLPTNGLKPG
jgi:hypothetical protein